MNNIDNQSLLGVLCEPGEQTLAVANPATGAVLGYIPVCSEAEITAAIARSHLAQGAWQRWPAKERAQLMQRWYELLMANQADLARLMTLEQGKPLAESMAEVAYGAAFIQWFAEEGKRALGTTIPAHTQDRRLVTIKQPVGVVAAITPWNFPIAMITRKAGPALAAGCSIIIKPANQTPLCAYAVVELARQAGIPDDVLQVVIHHSPELVGDIFTHHPVIKKLSFTGSTQVGGHLLAQCAGTVKNTSMELGGNAPFIVFDDADIELAVQGALAAKFRNGGQTCVCANRFYIHDTIYDQFVPRFIAGVKALKVGNGLEPDVQIGPMIDAAAKERVIAGVKQAQKQGAVIAAGGGDLGGCFVEPTVLVDVHQTMDFIQNELFGPVAPILRFNNDELLIAQANDTIYGLAAFFYSRDINRIWTVAEALDYGMVGINEGIISTELAPFGGVKQSGFGREGGCEGLDEYLETKYLCFGGIGNRARG